MTGEGIGIARRMERIRPFYVMALLERAKQLELEGRSVIHMEVGEPDFPTPGAIVAAGIRALEEGKTRYTPALGIPPLRRAIADFYRHRFGVDVDPGRVIVTPGASGALQLAMSVLIDPGQTVLMADPGYPCNRHFVELVGGRPKAVPVGPGTGYQLTAEQVAAHWTPETRAVLVATPSNPTGTLLSAAALREIHALVREKGGVLIVDEIYQGLTYGCQAETALALPGDLFVVNSFSKYFGMTGWRLGWLVAPDSHVDAVDRLAQNIFLSAPTVSQYAALSAFEQRTLDELEARRSAFQERRDFLLPALKALGFQVPVTPQGAFYLYANCRTLTDDSFRFATALLEAEGVAVTPGKDFGENAPESHIRFAYTTGIPRLAEGVERLRRFIEDPARALPGARR